MSTFCPALNKFLLILLFIFSVSLSNPVPSFSAACGNGNCQASQGENCNTCPQDCGSCPNPTSPPNPTTPPGGGNPTPTPGDSGSGNGSGNSSGSSDSSSSESGGPHITYYPSLSISSPKSPTNQSSIFFSGTASIEAGNISTVEYSITSGAEWLLANPSDGNYNSTSEGFSLSTPQLQEGPHTVLVRSRSGEGNYSQTYSYTITIATTPPTVNLDEDSFKPTNDTTPTINGTTFSKFATVTNTQVSINNGANYFPARISGNSFSYSPEKDLEDGNYQVIVRVFDNAGNITVTDSRILVVDTIPPIIGGSLVKIGSQILQPSSNGNITTVAGVENTLIMSMKGGVTKAFIKSGSESFKLESFPGTNLWFGNLIFKEQKNENLIVTAIDGANNETERQIQKVDVKNFGSIIDKSDGKSIVDAEVSMFYFDNNSKTWLLWQAEAYGQKNPQRTNSDGEYSFFLPPGKYYLEVKSLRYKTLQTEITEIKKNEILNPILSLHPLPSLTFSLPFFNKIVISPNFLLPPDTLSIEKYLVKEINETSTKTLKKAPEFTLPDINDKTHSLSEFSGKKILLTFLSPWSPLSLEQTSTLDRANKKLSGSEQIIGLSLQESSLSTKTFVDRGRYSFLFLADKDGDTATSYNVTLLPQNVFISSKGKIEEVINGVLSEKEIVDKLKKLE